MAGRRAGGDPRAWLKEERPRLQPLRLLSRNIRLELGLHPVDHACAPCTAARAVRSLAEEEKLPLTWEEVASVLPGQEGVAAPPPWMRTLVPGTETGPVRFLGPVRGDLMAAWVEALQDLDRTEAPTSSIWADVQRRLRRRHHFRVFGAPRCPDEVPVVRWLARLVHADPERLALDVIDVDTFPTLARRHGVRTLPIVTIDDFAHFHASPGEEHLAHALEDVLPSGGFAYPGARGDSPFGSF